MYVDTRDYERQVLAGRLELFAVEMRMHAQLAGVEFTKAQSFVQHILSQAEANRKPEARYNLRSVLDPFQQVFLGAARLGKDDD